MKIVKRLNTFLLRFSTGIDQFERHYLVARHVEDHFLNGKILDIGGRYGYFKRFLKLPVTVLNTDGTGDVNYDGGRIPFDKNFFECVVSFDTIEHIPPGERKKFVDECVRVAKKMVIITTPYGSEEHIEAEKELNEEYLKAFGKYHHYLNEHVELGLLSSEEIIEYTKEYGDVELFFSGNFKSQNRRFEKEITLRKRFGIFSLPLILIGKIFSRTIFHRVSFNEVQDEFSNRMYAILRINGE